MSKYTELADAEAITAEAEEPDDDDEETDEPDDEELDEETEPEARGPSEADLKRFESENARHEKALAKVIGDDWSSFAACGACGGVGFAPAPLVQYTPLNRDPNTEVCEVCAGFGATESGARPPAQVEIPCNACGGKGWNRKPEHVAPAPEYALETGTAPALEAAPTNGAPVDPRVAELRAAGYVIMDPIQVSPTS